MLIKATLSNARHPEYGEVTIPFPIKTSEYDHTMEMLANLEIGNVMGRDCKIMELSSPYSILQKLEGSEVNIDELDYINLHNYGLALLESHIHAETEYGLLERRDNQPIQCVEECQTEDQMEEMML